MSYTSTVQVNVKECSHSSERWRATRTRLVQTSEHMDRLVGGGNLVCAKEIWVVSSGTGLCSGWTLCGLILLLLLLLLLACCTQLLLRARSRIAWTMRVGTAQKHTMRRTSTALAGFSATTSATATTERSNLFSNQLLWNQFQQGKPHVLRRAYARDASARRAVALPPQTPCGWDCPPLGSAQPTGPLRLPTLNESKSTSL